MFHPLPLDLQSLSMICFIFRMGNPPSTQCGGWTPGNTPGRWKRGDAKRGPCGPLRLDDGPSVHFMEISRIEVSEVWHWENISVMALSLRYLMWKKHEVLYCFFGLFSMFFVSLFVWDPWGTQSRTIQTIDTTVFRPMNWPTLQACARRSSIFDPKHCPCKSVCSFDEFHASSRRVLLWVFRSWWCFLASQGSLRAGHGVAAIRSWDVSNPRSSIAPRRQSFAERCFTRSQLAIPTNCRCSVRKNEDDKGKPVFFFKSRPSSTIYRFAMFIYSALPALYFCWYLILLQPMTLPTFHRVMFLWTWLCLM